MSPSSGRVCVRMHEFVSYTLTPLFSKPSDRCIPNLATEAQNQAPKPLLLPLLDLLVQDTPADSKGSLLDDSHAGLRSGTQHAKKLLTSFL